jgi:hypothetical protein
MSINYAQTLYDAARSAFDLHQRETHHTVAAIWCDECNALGYIAVQAATSHQGDTPRACGGVLT